MNEIWLGKLVLPLAAVLAHCFWRSLSLLLVGASAALAQPANQLATTTYRYDETANKVTQIDALGRETTWTVDAKDRVTARVLPDGTRETNAYDAADNLLAKTTFAGERLTFTYDLNDRLASLLVPAGAGGNQAITPAALQFRFSASGQLTLRQEQGSTTLAGEQAFRYDAMDRVLESRSPAGLISYGRNAAGQITEKSVTDAGTVRYEYDDAGRMTRVIAPDGKQTRYSYDTAGRLDMVERDLRARAGEPQMLRTFYRYDNADRIVSIAHIRKQGAALALVVAQQLIRAAGGAIIQIDTDRGDGTTTSSGTLAAQLDVRQLFEYDGLARLTREIRADGGGTIDTRYAYDLVGNRTRKTAVVSGGTEITYYSYDEADRLVAETTTLPAGGSRLIAYTWDANGNLASKTATGSVTLYRFDPRNRLIDIRQGATAALAQAAQPHVRYAYDADGNRVRKWGAEARTYLVDKEEGFAQLVREASAAGTVNYLRGLGLIRQTRTSTGGTEDLFPLPGHLGSSLGAVNADGDLVEQMDVDAFGNLDLPTGAKQAHLFAGEFWDQDAQLLYLRARWYDPRIGRFVSGDPFEGRVRDPRSLNRYSYAHSDPVGNVDPTGLVTMMDVTFTNFTNSYNKGSDAKRAYDSFDRVRATLCKGADFTLSPINNLHHIVPKFMGGKDGNPNLLDLPENVHHAFHKLLSYALVLDGFPAPSKGAPKFIDFMTKNAGSRDKSTKVLLEVAEYVDNVCAGVRGYDKIKPAIEKVLPILDIFVF